MTPLPPTASATIVAISRHDCRHHNLLTGTS
jgi:hypothetical protein